ncbi:Interferon-induced 6-16 [Desmophyllum pertusum]|uniref:Interferon-induced 6-16 n=1 Tax=Desmophyllum pertusum TaxID=174260 RepID=A0A9W9YTJ5_9CNID|nr:Interferon-induced 6-16 [Desmophyllum pertusum]
MDKTSYLCIASLAGELVSSTSQSITPHTSFYKATNMITETSIKNCLSPYTAGWSWTDMALAGVVGTVAVVAAPAVLTAAGFTSAGVAAGSFAAAAQSTYGGYVASGSLFAASQSAGVVGIGLKTATTIFAVAGGATLCAKEK